MTTTPAAASEAAACCACSPGVSDDKKETSTLSSSSVGGYSSPLEAMREGEVEKLLYIPAVLHRSRFGGSGSRGKERKSPEPDYLATVDLDPASPTFSKVIHRLPMPTPGDELHHMGWNACSSCRDRPGISRTHAFLVVPGVVSGNLHFVDVATDPRAPRLAKTILGSELQEKVGVALPHTSHCAPESIIVSFMGSRETRKEKGEKKEKKSEGEGGGEEGDDEDDEDEFTNEGNGFVEFDPFTFAIKSRWEEEGGATAAAAAGEVEGKGKGDGEEGEEGEGKEGGGEEEEQKSSSAPLALSHPRFGYDFWYQLHPSVDTLVSSEWGHPASFTKGFDPADVAAGKYGSRLYFYSFSKRKLEKVIDLGLGSIPLEVRFLHRPDAAEGYVGCALSSEMVRFVRKEKEEGGGEGGERGGGERPLWSAEAKIKVEPVGVTGWVLPSMPALVTDFVISLDDKYLFLACWLHGEVRQYDIGTDPENPRLVGKVSALGGLLHAGNRGGVARADGEPLLPPVTIKGQKIRGGAQMIQLSLDGKRLYVSTSLFSSWDEQFYGEELTKAGGQLLRILVAENGGGLEVDESFLVDFGGEEEPWGPALVHEMRFPGGDSTSDIWK